MLHKDNDRKGSVERKISVRDPQGACGQYELTRGKPAVVKSCDSDSVFRNIAIPDWESPSETKLLDILPTGDGNCTNNAAGLHKSLDKGSFSGFEIKIKLSYSCSQLSTMLLSRMPQWRHSATILNLDTRWKWVVT
jgi:hypothetical protein